MSCISMDPHAITDAVNNLSGMSITYSANEIETIAGQMNSIGKMTHGKIPELVMGGMLTRDGVELKLFCQVHKRNKGTC